MSTIVVRVRGALGDALERSIRARVDEALAARPDAPAPRVVGPRDEPRGAHVVVPLTPRQARHLAALVARLERAGAAAIQLAWIDGPLPPALEQAVFAVLEARRGRPSVVFLTDTLEPPGPPACAVTRA